MTQQAEQYRDFKAGLKPLLVLEKRKDRATFFEALIDYTGRETTHYHLHLWHSPEGIELVLAKHYSTIQDYLVTLHYSQLWDQTPTTARRRLGALFGYSNDKINKFVSEWKDGDCSCSKCVGVDFAKALREIEKDARDACEQRYAAARTEYHDTTMYKGQQEPSRLERDAMLARTQPYGRAV